MTKLRKPSVDLISEEDAQAVLGSLHQPLAIAVCEAFALWRDVVAPHLPRFKPRTQADVIQDAIDTKLRTVLGANPAIEFAPPTSDRFWLRVAGVLVRFKKINGDGTTSNYRTESANAFDMQMKLPGIPDGARLTVGYQLNRDNTEIIAVWVALFRGQKLMWKYELVADAAGVVSIASPLRAELPGVGLKLKPNAKKKSDIN